jgi:hypothetical protein
MRPNSIWGEVMGVVSVPKPPQAAYDPQRAPGTLLQNQLEHLEWAVRPAGARTAGTFKFTPAATEQEVASRVEALMREMHRKTVGRDPVIPHSPPRARPAKPAAPTTAATTAAKPRRRRR